MTPDYLTDLPDAVRDFFDATNASDTQRFLAAFAPDGAVDDWGRVFRGRDEISRWNDNENMGVDSHFELTRHSVEGDVHIVGIHVTGRGYNGGGSMEFTLDGDRIGLVTITG